VAMSIKDIVVSSVSGTTDSGFRMVPPSVAMVVTDAFRKNQITNQENWLKQ
jgi:hypothetical protein